MKKNLLMCALWPGFLGASVLEIFVFALVDPSDLHISLMHGEVSPLVIYTGAFFVFWIGTTISSILTAVLTELGSDIDRRLRATGKPKG